MNEVVQIETTVAGRESLRKVARLLIRALCRVARFEVDFVPLGKAGDMVPGMVRCLDCQGAFFISVSMCNESFVTCPYCGKGWLARSNLGHAWLVK